MSRPIYQETLTYPSSSYRFNAKGERMLVKVYSSCLLGIDAYGVEVEVDLAPGGGYVLGAPEFSKRSTAV